MTEALQCPGCRSPLPGDAPSGLCPNCLLQFAFVADEPPPHAASTSAYRGPFEPPAPGELAALFPHLEILELLGQGGMGAVYKARQSRLDRLVALKIVPRELARSPEFAERFSREARALARLSHPNIVAVHDFGEVKGLYYFIMEYVDGVNLRQMLLAGPIESGQALAIVPQVCEALQYAHDKGIVHRDIKPENILIDRKGVAKIADFGLAKLLGQPTPAPALTDSRQIMGTPHYMAPEQVDKPLEVDHRADIYSLGVVFYELLTGELPLGRFLPPSQKAQVDARLDEVVLRTLDRDPGRRYQQVSEMRTAVQAIIGPELHQELQALGSLLDVSPTELLALGGIGICLGLLGFGLWETRSTFVLFGLPFAAKVAGRINWGPSGRLFGGLLLAVGGIGLSILAIHWNRSGWWVLLFIWLWYADYVYAFVGGSKDGGQVPDQDEDAEAAEAEGPIADLAAKDRVIWNVVKKYESDAGLFLIPDLPAEGLHNARKCLAVPPSERILALLDFTSDEEDCKQSLLFGTEGVYCLAIVRDKEVPIAVPYQEFPERSFVSHGLVVYLGKDQFLKPDLDNSPADCEMITRVLNALRLAVIARKTESASKSA